MNEQVAFRKDKEKKNAPVPMEVDKMLDGMMKMMTQEDDGNYCGWDHGGGGQGAACSMNNLQRKEETEPDEEETWKEKMELMMSFINGGKGGLGKGGKGGKGKRIWIAGIVVRKVTSPANVGLRMRRWSLTGR